MGTQKFDERPFSRVVVTGGCGFLGSHLVESLVDEGCEVLAIDNFATGLRSTADLLADLKSVRVAEHDICENWNASSEVRDFFKKPVSHIFHFASPASPTKYTELPLETMWANSVGLGKALDFATSLGSRLIFSSSSEVYGFAPPPHAESAMGVANCFGPRACYVEGKRFGEALVYSYNQKYGASHGVVRIFNTYGPRMSPDDGRVVLNLGRRAIKGESLQINGDGNQTRSFCYVEDLNRGLLAYAARMICHPLNLGNDRQISINELALKIRRMVGNLKLPIEHLPSVQDEPIHRQPDLEQSLKLLQPWRPSVELDEGLKLTLEWIRSNYVSLSAEETIAKVPVAAI